MAQTNINIRMDENLKRDFEHLCGELGMNMTTAFNIFARTMVRYNGIPFEVSLNIPNAETRAAIEENKEMAKHPERYKSYNNADEMMEDLLRDET